MDDREAIHYLLLQVPGQARGTGLFFCGFRG